MVALTSMPDALTFTKVLELVADVRVPHAGHAAAVHPASGQFWADVPQLNVQSVAREGTAHKSDSSPSKTSAAVPTVRCRTPQVVR